jgi:hypothetical protein
MAKFPDVSQGEIVINVTTDMKYRVDQDDVREHISYDIEVPLKKIVSANIFLGIPDSANQAVYIQSGYVLSEVPSP